MNTAWNVNSEMTAVSALAESLRNLFTTINLLHGWEVHRLGAQSPDSGWDLLATGPLPGNAKGAFYIECKTNFTPSLFSSLADRPLPPRHPRRSSRVLAMPSVSLRLRELCAEHGWSWFDLAGNCHLDLPGALYVERLGNPPVVVDRKTRTHLHSPESNRILRALLAPENGGRVWTQRDLVAHYADLAIPVPPPSLALVNKVVQHLREEAFVESLAPHGFRVSNAEKLFQRWLESSRRSNRPPLRAFTIHHGRSLESKLLKLSSQSRGSIALASFSAADHQAPYVRQPRTYLVAHPSLRQELLQILEAKLVDSGENLIIRETEDPGLFYALDSRTGRPDCTNPAQTALDLSLSASRGEEAAEAILEKVLRPAWSGRRQRAHAN